MSGDRLDRAMAAVAVALLPADLRAEHGGDIVQLVLDRRRHGGEPRWRLWPSTLVDCTTTSIRLRRERAVPYVRPVLAGSAFGIGGFALLSRAGVPGLILILLGFVVLALTSKRVSAAGRPPAGSWRPFALGGLAMGLLAVGGLVAVAGRSPGPFVWVALLVALIAGLGALSTAAVLAVDARRSPPAPSLG